MDAWGHVHVCMCVRLCLSWCMCVRALVCLCVCVYSHCQCLCLSVLHASGYISHWLSVPVGRGPRWVGGMAAALACVRAP
jgi:hypothetical protein